MSRAFRWLLAMAVVVLLVLGLYSARDEFLDRDKKDARPAGPKFSLAAVRNLPVCPDSANPLRGDCLPQHLANLPPHPGKAGEATVEGVDSNRDGVRDDVEIFIAENFGHSERAVRALRLFARDMQSDMVDPPRTPEEAIARERDRTAIFCYSRSVDEGIRLQGNPLMEVVAEVANTPERFDRFRRREKLFAGQVLMAPDPRLTVEQLCGYDPASLRN